MRRQLTPTGVSNIWSISFVHSTLRIPRVSNSAQGGHHVPQTEVYAAVKALGRRLPDQDTWRRIGRRAGGHLGLEVLGMAGVVVFADGTITAQYMGRQPPHKIAAVTGGTGKYIGARGQMTLVESGHDNSPHIVLTFRLLK